MSLKPKECIHTTCRNIFYVPEYLLHMMTTCPECTEKLSKRFKEFYKDEENK